METILNIEQLKYPIGKFEYGKAYTNEQIQNNIKTIEQLPSLLKIAAAKLTPELLKTAYRPEGWTAQQVIHHIADSHINALIRLKLTLTENNPTIKPYKEALWAQLADVNEPIEVSLSIIENVHKRLVAVLKAMKEKEFERTYFHPESNKTFTLAEMTGLYAWHGNHHLKHVEIVLNSK